MAETKEEKAIREAQEAEAKLASDAKALADAEELKVKEAAELEKQDEIPSHLVEVELHEDNTESVLKNVHTVFHALGSTEFIDGKANVNPDVAAFLKESKQVK